jgi:hypothetical protein
VSDAPFFRIFPDTDLSFFFADPGGQLLDQGHVVGTINDDQIQIGVHDDENDSDFHLALNKTSQRLDDAESWF